MALHGEGQLFPHYIGEIDRFRLLGQRVVIGIVGGIGVGRKDRRVYVDIDLAQHLGQAATAVTSHYGVNVPAPEVLPISRGLQLPPNRHRSHQLQVEVRKGRIVRGELAVGPDRPSLEVPDIHSQHSRLN
jgi:hypothetical protein